MSALRRSLHHALHSATLDRHFSDTFAAARSALMRLPLALAPPAHLAEDMAVRIEHELRGVAGLICDLDWIRPSRMSNEQKAW